MEIAIEKKKLRVEMLKKRSQLEQVNKSSYDEMICGRLLDYIQKNQVQTVHAYLPIAGEINIKPLLEELIRQKITVVCPKTLPKRELENRILTDLKDLETGIMGTLHPRQNRIYTGAYSLIIVPGLAFDEDCYRLGYGGGYYDTFISKNNGATTIGIFYPFQKIERVPRETHDMRLNSIIYEPNL